MRTETIEKTYYTFDELSDKAKEKARDWYRETMEFDDESTIDDFCEIAKLIGVDLKTETVRLYGGGSRQKPCVYFSGFSCQGDGACFEGWYYYRKGAAKAVKAYAPHDKELHRIVDELQAVQKEHFYALTAKMEHSGSYYHSGYMSVDVEDGRNSWRDIGDAEGEIRQLMRDLADWLYRSLKSSYEFEMSDESVDDCIMCNEYEFDENGHIA